MKWTSENIKAGGLFATTSKFSERICCAYKLHFEGGFFYIGHTGCLKSRIQTHVSCLKNANSPYPEDTTN
jgi:hypothetical protein